MDCFRIEFLPLYCSFLIQIRVFVYVNVNEMLVYSQISIIVSVYDVIESLPESLEKWIRAPKADVKTLEDVI